MTNLRPFLMRAGGAIRRRLAYRLVNEYRLAEQQQAIYLRRLLHVLRIDCVLDVGGNAGQFYRFLRRSVGYTGTVVTFEPLPHLAHALRKSARRDTRWHIHDVAIGSACETKTLNVMASSPLSSFLMPSSDEDDQLRELNRVVDKVEVRVRTLTEALKELKGPINRFYLKLDTQGFELECLRGASDVLPMIPALQVELSVSPLYDGMPPYYEVMRELHFAGYRLSMAAAINPRQFPRLIDFDGHFVRIDER